MTYVLNQQYKYKCPVCGNDHATCIHDTLRYDFPAYVLKCTSCEQVFLSDFPHDQELKNYYSSQYWQEYGGLSSMEQRFQAGHLE